MKNEQGVNFLGGGVEKMSFLECERYRKEIIEMVEKIENPAILKRIYQLVEYLYVYKKGEE